MSIDTTAAVPADTAVDIANGLRALAQLIEDNPPLADHLKYPARYMNAPISTVADPRAALAEFARAAAKQGAEVTKDFDDKWGGVTATFGPVSVHMYAPRAQVCERVVTGTREVVREVPDPDALAAVPTVQTTVTEDVVEWRCVPLLADDAPEAGA